MTPRESVVHFILILSQVVRFETVSGDRLRGSALPQQQLRIAVCSGPAPETRQCQGVLDRRPSTIHYRYEQRNAANLPFDSLFRHTAGTVEYYNAQ